MTRLVDMSVLVDPSEAIETADEILSRSEYQEPSPSLLGRALDKVFEWLDRLFTPVAGSFGSVTIGYVILAIVGGAAAFFLWRFARRFSRKSAVDRDEGHTVEYHVSEQLSRAEWLSRAAEAESAGEWDAAVHARYHALTAGLSARDHLAAAPSATSGEHRTRFASDESDLGRVQRFGLATDRYEHVWFGGVDAGRPDSEVLESVDRELLS